jgi:hypothetical protein
MQKLQYKASTQLRSRTLIVLLFSILMGLGLLYYVGSLRDWKSYFVYFFLLFSFLSSFRVLMRKWTLVVDEKGLHSAVNGMQLVEWKYIDHFFIKKNNRNQSFLVVKLNEEEAYLKTKNPMTRLLMRSNVRALGSSVVLPQAEFHKDLEEVKAEIEAYQQRL